MASPRHFKRVIFTTADFVKNQGEFPPGVISASRVPHFAGITGTSAIVAAKEVFFGIPQKFTAFGQACIEHGRMFEPEALDHMCKFSGFEGKGYKKHILYTDKQVSFKTLFTDGKTQRFLQATPDGVSLYNGGSLESGTDLIPIEVKCPYTPSGGLLKLHWWLQSQIQILVMGAPHGFVGVYENEQISVYQIFPTPSVEQYILDVVFDTYEKSEKATPENVDSVFRFKNGVKHNNFSAAARLLLQTTFVLAADGSKKPFNTVAECHAPFTPIIE